MPVYTTDCFKPFTIAGPLSADISKKLATSLALKTCAGCRVLGRKLQLPYGYLDAAASPSALGEKFKQIKYATNTTHKLEVRGSLYHKDLPVQEFPYTTNAEEAGAALPLKEVHPKDLQHAYVLFKRTRTDEPVNADDAQGGYAFTQQGASNFNMPGEAEGDMPFQPTSMLLQGNIGRVSGPMGCSEAAFMTTKAIYFVMHHPEMLPVLEKVLAATTAEEIKSLTQGKNMPVSQETIKGWDAISVQVMQRAVLNKFANKTTYDLLMNSHIACKQMGIREPRAYEVCPFGDKKWAAGFSKGKNEDGTPTPAMDNFLAHVLEHGMDTPGENLLGQILTNFAETFTNHFTGTAWDHDAVLCFIQEVEQKSCFFQVETAPEADDKHDKLDTPLEPLKRTYSVMSSSDRGGSNTSMPDAEPFDSGLEGQPLTAEERAKVFHGCGHEYM